MQDDKEEASNFKPQPEQSIPELPESQLKPGLERPSGLESEGKPEIEARQEQERAPEKEIERIQEQPAAKQPPQADSEDEKLKILKEADKLRDMKYESRKIEHLMKLAQKKGVGFAVEVAKKTNDACLLDLLHDKIIEKGLNKDL